MADIPPSRHDSRHRFRGPLPALSPQALALLTCLAFTLLTDVSGRQS